MTIEKITFAQIPHCLKLFDSQLELVVTTAFGPRILFCGRPGGENFFKRFENDLKHPDPEKWHNYGGHRLWHAPEVRPRTYFPDNAPVPFAFESGKLHLDCPEETVNGIKKSITIAIKNGQAVIEQTITNTGRWNIKLAAWGISVMAPGGRLIVPLPKYRPHGDETLQPTMPLALWSYTDMSDPRFRWGRRFIEMAENAAADAPALKFGAAIKAGFAAYELHGSFFLKRFPYEEKAEYPDFNCNFESYTQPGMLEIEALGPLTELAPGESTCLTEEWQVFDKKPDFLN